MYDTQTAFDKFKEILTGKTVWEKLKNSQFVEHLSLLVGWCLRQAQFAVERAKQEFFLSTALNRSSIIAHVEDREYIPRKPQASIGQISIKNNGAAIVAIPARTELLTDEDITVRNINAKVINPGETVIFDAEQRKSVEQTHIVSNEVNFYEILIDRDKTPYVEDFTVYVDENDGFGLRKYNYARLLQNTEIGGRSYDEFYSHSEQIGIRFGNGNFGRILKINEIVNLNITETEGDIFISSGQELFPVDEILDANKNIASLEIKVSTAFSGGSNAEETETIRKNLHYWTTYDESLVWDDDYAFYLKRKFPQILFIKAWGEQQQEAMVGYSSLDFINKIFICAYAENYIGLGADCIEALEEVPLLNRKFEFTEPVHIPFTVNISGKVLQDAVLTDAINSVKDILEENYGKNSSKRRESVILSEIYDLIQGTGFFPVSSGAKFNVEISGQSEPNYLYEMVSIDLEASTFNITY